VIFENIQHISAPIEQGFSCLRVRWWIVGAVTTKINYGFKLEKLTNLRRLS